MAAAPPLLLSARTQMSQSHLIRRNPQRAWHESSHGHVRVPCRTSFLPIYIVTGGWVLHKEHALLLLFEVPPFPLLLLSAAKHMHGQNCNTCSGACACASV